jgi:hypothetical protein
MESRATNHPEGTPPSLTELFSRYLANADLAAVDAQTGLVEPYDTGLPHSVDARLAWQGAQASLASVSEKGARLVQPAEWIPLVQARDSYFAVALAAGNYPQMLHDLPGLLQIEHLADLRTAPAPMHDLPDLSAWAERTAKTSFAGRMLAAGVMRLAGQFDAAAAFLRADEPANQAPTQVLRNERAALLWSRGDCDQAVKLWQEMADSTIGQFNLGMATLFDKPSEALPFLQAATASMADDDPWRHLGGIYLALAEMRA